MTFLLNRVTKVSYPYLIVFISFSIMLGCSGEAKDQPDLGQVTGIITLDDTPLEGATVTFTPEKGRPSTGITDASGKYELFYIGDTAGANFGKHKVSISKMVDKAVEPGKVLTPEEKESGNKEESIIAKYNSSSTLAADVKTGANTFDFKITSK